MSTGITRPPIMVPHLAATLKGPLLDLKSRILDAQPAIEHWLRTQWQEHPVPFYSSVDLRNSGWIAELARRFLKIVKEARASAGQS